MRCGEGMLSEVESLPNNARPEEVEVEVEVEFASEVVATDDSTR
jgi:hypothetical protein